MFRIELLLLVVCFEHSHCLSHELYIWPLTHTCRKITTTGLHDFLIMSCKIQIALYLLKHCLQCSWPEPLRLLFNDYLHLHYIVFLSRCLVQTSHLPLSLCLLTQLLLMTSLILRSPFSPVVLKHILFHSNNVLSGCKYNAVIHAVGPYCD